MKLPDFLNYEPLNELRRKMGGAKLGEVLSIRLGDRLSVEELDQLTNQGIDVKPTEIEFLSDGTLAYKGRRVLLYIRDIEEYSYRSRDLPRFHVAHCRTLEQMLHANRFDRYVVATRTDGVFNLNHKKAWAKRYTPIERELAVCQNCLDHLGWEGFSILARPAVRKTAVASFSIANFFSKYGTPVFKATPKYSDQDAPVNEYSADFSAVSARIKADRNWTCENCGVKLSGSGEHQYLQVHHNNGVKSDNSPSNLIALCIRCHAGQPGHAHLQWSPAYHQFLGSHWSEQTSSARTF